MISTVLRIDPDAMDDEVWAKSVAKATFMLGELRNYLTIFNNGKE